jgi:hypothetical protein
MGHVNRHCEEQSDVAISYVEYLKIETLLQAYEIATLISSTLNTSRSRCTVSQFNYFLLN